MHTHDDDRVASEPVAPGVSYLRTLMVNVYFVALGEDDRDSPWVLIDAGLPGFGRQIRQAARHRFGDRPPAAIVLTHGHFDHVGSLRDLLAHWRVPVYAHLLEFPYLTGELPYPAPDPRTGGGLLALISPLYPRGPIDISGSLQPLPPGGGIPPMSGWHWLHTPGHAPGHLSLFRPADRVLIAGDAVVTTKQESLVDVLLQRPQVWRPPAYYTTDWHQAEQSVRAIDALEPAVLATGHGRPMADATMREQLHQLADQFPRLAVPASGRYVSHPEGSADEQIARGDSMPSWTPLAFGVGFVAAGLLAWRLRRRR